MIEFLGNMVSLLDKGAVGIMLFFIVTLGFLSIVLAIVVTRKRFLEYMDIKFQGFYVDYGIMFNGQRAGIYGIVLTYPKLLATKTYENVDFDSIPLRKRLIFISYTWSIFLTSVLLILFVWLDENHWL